MTTDTTHVCRFCAESVGGPPEMGMDGEPMPQEAYCSETCRDADQVRTALEPNPAEIGLDGYPLPGGLYRFVLNGPL